MLVILAAALMVCTAVAWAVSRRGGYVLAAILILAAVTIGTLEGRLVVREHQWSKAASYFIGKDTAVNCQRFIAYAIDSSSVLGFVPADPETGDPMQEAYLRRDTCDHLAEWDKENPTERQVEAVHILTHEAVHMSGVKNEAETECIALQRNSVFAMLLGASPAKAKELSMTYWTHIHNRLPDQYHSKECAAGGKLDLDLPTSPWNLLNEKSETPDTDMS